MYLHSLKSLCLSRPSSPVTTHHYPRLHQNHNLFSGVLFLQEKDKQHCFDIRTQCNVVSKPGSQGFDELHDDLTVIKCQEIIESADIDVEPFDNISISNEIEKHVAIIKSLLESMNDGEISISAYDTAWVALIEKKSTGNGDKSTRTPQFPECLKWIADNQLPDGSWGDLKIFSAHDRIINTLACVVALKSWNIYPGKFEKGMCFFKENLSKLEDENAEHMTIGFEVVFPSILDMAEKLEIEVPHDSPVLKEIYAKRNIKLSRIPKEMLHEVPTPLLFSLEAMEGLNWKKLLKLQSPDGSFLFSPSSTAYAFIQTQDPNCFNYLKKTVDRFNGGVPNVYPVDLFERLWGVDRLERLGISRHFYEEIEQCMNYVNRYWTDKGICWARNSPFTELDDTSMGFRLLRLHGHHVSADVFEIFKKGNGFEGVLGQATESVTVMFNFYRASHLQFPGEKILGDARNFSASFLTRKREAGQIMDKWTITKGLSGEVSYALDIPWLASLPRLETRYYIMHYGGDEDVWIGKGLYRMHNVHNNIYLELAKLDYNTCQALHLVEWDNIQRWYSETEIGGFGINKKALLFAYFVAAASIFEPERAGERLAWAKTLILVETIDSLFDPEIAANCNQRRAFASRFRSTNGRTSVPKGGGKGFMILTLLETLSQLSLDVLECHGREIYFPLCDAWENWLMGWQDEGDKYIGLAELLVHTISLASGRCSPEELTSIPSYNRLCHLSNHLCRLLGQLKSKQENDNCCSDIQNINDLQVEPIIQELVQLVLQVSTNPIEKTIKGTFLMVVKSFYYNVVCDHDTIEFHITKVLFEKVN